MLKQLKYAARQSLQLRLAALAIVLVINAAFGILGSANLYGGTGKITAVTLSSLTLCGLFIVSVIADAQSLKWLSSGPVGYPVLLAPVACRTILLARIVTIVVFDLVSWAIGVACVVWQSLLLTNTFDMVMNNHANVELWAIPFVITGYLLIVTAIHFCGAVSCSLFFRVRFRKLLLFLSVAAVLYVMSFVDILMAAVVPVTRIGPFFSVTLYVGFNPGTMVYILLMLVKTGALFLAASSLLERRVNL